MAKAPGPVRLSLSQARAVILAASGFPPPGKPALIPTLERTGFVRTLGGVDVYLAVRARVPGLRRADLDRAVEAHEAQVVPSVRGCIYLVPGCEVAASLRAADLLSRPRAEREWRKAGIRGGEVERVAEAAFKLLKSKGPMTTDALRRALPEGVVRSLGEAGKKVGISSPLPAALRVLEFAGRIERTLEGGRLDTERYHWRVAARNTFTQTRLPSKPDELWQRFADGFYRAAGVATVKQFATWAGLALKDAKAASEACPLVPVEIEGRPEPYRLHEENRRLVSGSHGGSEAVAFLPFDDNLTALHDGPALLVDKAHHGLPVPQWGSKDTTLGASRHMAFRSFVANGKIAGFWEFDPGPGRLVVGWFAKPGAAARARVAEEAEATARFITGELGHGRSFSLDTEAELADRARRIAALRLS